jgi:predicted nucleic acid-binding Zn ribbon protein
MQLSDEQKRQRRRRNIALGLVLGVFILLVYVVTIVKMGG